METVQSRSESPLLRSKAKGLSTDTPENGNGVEQVKSKSKKNLRSNKNKLQQMDLESATTNGKGNEDLNNGKDLNEEEKSVEGNGEVENGVNTENGTHVDIQQEETQEVTNDQNNDGVIDTGENSNETSAPETSEEVTETGTTEEVTTINNEDCTEKQNSLVEGNNVETESNGSKDNFVLCESHSDEISEEKCNGDKNDIHNGDTIEQEQTEASLANKDVTENSLNGSDDSLQYEEANLTKEDTLASPDTATKDENSKSNMIASFLGKWTSSPEQKQESEISSTKKSDTLGLNHPYLSKVSGRRGIRDKLNSSTNSFSFTEKEAKTPDQKGISLDDSFRVRTNPPRLNSVDLNENPTLRKFKGKRCLNAGDEPEEEDDDIYLNSIKRRKFDEKTQNSGLLGGVLWSPFKKKSLEGDNQLKIATNESKLSRLLSPFWFWKKTTEGQKEK